jgi:type VI secretion system protein ImpK
MNPLIATQMHKVFGRGLELKERLERGDRPRFDIEHAELRKLLWADGQLATDPEYAGALGAGGNIRATMGSGLDRDASFLGIRYALACWLDEIFIGDSPWSEDWTDQTMEVELVGYGTNERAWRFWRQARKAASRPGTDALEVYLWCVMLGFRGDPEGEGVNVVEWAERTRNHIIQTRNQKFPHDAGSPPKPDVPILTGRRQFTRMVRAGAVTLAAAAFFAGYLALRAPAQ